MPRLPFLLLSLPLLAAGCAAPGLEPPAGAQPRDVGHALCMLGFTAVPLQTLVSGHHLVDVTLNGRPATFVLDTGAGATVLHAPFAAQFGVTGEPTFVGPAAGLGGMTAAQQFRIQNFAIAGSPTTLNRIVTLDLGTVVNLLTPIAGRQVHGIIGQEVMVAHRMVIDVHQPAAHLMPAGAVPGQAPRGRC